MTIEYQPIGVVHSPFVRLEDIPDQPHFAKGKKGTVEVFPDFQVGLRDLAGFSLDVKPYVGEFDKLKGVRIGWLESLGTLTT